MKIWLKTLNALLCVIIATVSVCPAYAASRVTTIRNGNGYYEIITSDSDDVVVKSYTGKNTTDLDKEITKKTSEIKNKIEDMKKDIFKRIENFYLDFSDILIDQAEADSGDANNNSGVDKEDGKNDNNNEGDDKKENNKPSEPATYPEYVTKVAELTNAERAKRGLTPLKISDALCSAAQAHADDMYNNNYFSHESLDGRTLRDRIEAYSTDYGWLGENIALGCTSPEGVVECWMGSEGHKENILSGNYTDIGIGYNNGYWVQDFGG